MGPILEAREVLGVSWLPSIAALDLHSADMAACSMGSNTAEFDVDSGQVEISIELSATGAVDNITLVFSVTILAAA